MARNTSSKTAGLVATASRSAKPVTTTAAKKARKAATAAKAEPAKNGRMVDKTQTANRGQDAVAILFDGSTHAIPRGMNIAPGDHWDTKNTAFLAEQRRAKPAAQLARGVEARTSPQSAKAVADQRRAAKPAAAPAAEKKAARKAARAEKAAPKADDTRKLTIVDKKFSFGGDGTARRACWDAAVSTAKAKGTVADYVKAGGKAKYLPRWASAGAIKLA